MAGISSANAALPQNAMNALSQSDVSSLQAAGIPDDIIGVADRTRAASSGATSYDASPAPATTTPAPTVADAASTTAAQGDVTTQAPAGDLDTSDDTFPELLKSHVMVLRAIGSSEAVISGIAADRPNAGVLEQYIKSEILQNPEGWDAHVGNPTGTARAGLIKLMPGVQLPAPGAGTPGVASDGSTMNPDIPGITTPLVDPASTPVQGANQLMKVLVWGAVGVGAAFLGWKFLKNRNAAKALVEGGGEVAKAATKAQGLKWGAKAAKNVAAPTDLKQLMAAFGGGGAGAMSDDVLTAYIVSQGKLAGSPAMLHQARNGLAPANEALSQLMNGAANYNLDPQLVLKWDILHQAGKVGGLSSMLGTGVNAGGLMNGLDDILRGAAQAL